MTNKTAIPRDDANKLGLLQHLNTSLPSYAVVLEISAADLAQLQAGLDGFDYCLKAQDAANNYNNALFAFKRVLRDGPKTAEVNLPTAPSLPAAPSTTLYADIFGFIGDLIARIKHHRNYTEAIGKALNIISAHSPDADPSTLQPILTVDFQADQPMLHWKGNGADALEIEVDYGSGSFSLLSIQLSPGYLDLTPLPAPGSTALWKYRAIYRIHDQRVGQWSQILEVSVKG